MSDRPRPTDEEIEAMLALHAPARLLARPVFRGLDNIPEHRPLLFVGNHTIYGVLDVSFFFAEIYRQKGIFLRALGDHLHFKIPGWRSWLSRFGVVDGTPDNAARLLRERECVLVFPGGGREVAKRKGEAYKLIWKERVGFARLAIEHGAQVVPFASVGVEHAYDVVLDADEMLASPVGDLIRATGVRPDIVLPLAKGIGPTPIPRPERLYFQVQPPIDTAPYAGLADRDAAARQLRDEVKASLERAIAELLEVREADPERPLGRRLLSGAREVLQQVMGAGPQK